MAGIGFQLRKLNRSDSITSVVSSVGHAAVIAARPWLFTIFALATITMTSEPVAGMSTLATFRVVIIYAFASSLVLSAPIAIVATRRVADALWQKKPEEVPPLLFGAFVLALPVVMAGAGALSIYFQLDGDLAIALLAASSLVALIWIVLSFCGAVRDYNGVTMSFLLGLLLSLLMTVTAAVLGFHAAGMVWGFVSGLTVTFFGMTHRVLATFPQPMTSATAGALAIVDGLLRYWHLALGALLGTTAVWIDKWLFWFSPAGETTRGGLVHAPPYDSAMFIASLVIIPSLAAFVMKLETEFFDRYQQYYAIISSHGTMGEIEQARGRLARYTLDNLALITVTQVGICAVLVLTAPLIIDALDLRFQQIAILRYGALGAVFQFIFIACTSMLLFFDRRRLYLGLQALFLALNILLTVLSIGLGEDFYGVGYFIACLISAFVAYRLADQTFENLNFLTFIGNNPSVGSSRKRLRLGQKS